MYILCGQSYDQSEGAVDVGLEEYQRSAMGWTGRGIMKSGLTQDQKNRVVEYHNNLRKGEGSSDMEKLVRIVWYSRV